MIRRVQTLLLILLAALLLIQAAFSLRWQIAHDEAPLLYESFLMQSEGRMPYRDLFDFQMPGAYLSYYVLGALSSFSPLRLRLLDLLILSALLFITYSFMKKFGRQTALFAAVLFGLMYMQGGALMSLQREYLFLPFVAAAMWINFRRESISLSDDFLAGCLFGFAAIIKPHAALGILPILIFRRADLIQRPARIFLLGIGFSLPVFFVVTWLALHHALMPFIDIARNYWGLYSQINGQMEITPAGTRLGFLLAQGIKLGGYAVWLIPSLAGLYITPQENKKYAILLAGVAACYAVYPLFTGQFFEYHYIPLAYSLALLASLSVGGDSSRMVWSRWAALALVVALLINLRPSSTFLRQMEGKPLVRPTDRAQVIANYLQKNLEEGDTVQPLDWTGGTLLAMLQSRAPLATQYVFDFYFYHHISNPYIQNLRADFMNQMREKNPRFIIEVTAADKPWVSGEDTTREFPELRDFINRFYSAEMQRPDFVIYIRR